MDIANVRPEMSREIVSGLPAQQVDREAQVKAQVRPVEKSDGAARAALDEQRLRKDEGEAKSQARREDVRKVVEEIQLRMEQMGTNLQFTVDREAEDLVVKVTNKVSGKLIRQIPSEDVLKLRMKLEELSGLLFDEKT
jgi:flagellar protein FlaG